MEKDLLSSDHYEGIIVKKILSGKVKGLLDDHNLV